MTGQQSALMAIPRDRVAAAQGPACCQASWVQALTLGPVGFIHSHEGWAQWQSSDRPAASS